MSGITIEKNDETSTRFTFTNGSLIVLIRNGDLSQEPCDALVNSTNTWMNPSGGLDKGIHQLMGQFFTDQVVSIHIAMKEDSCQIGQSRIFVAHYDDKNINTRFIINTVGPVYSEETKEYATFLLKSCYHTSLALANLYQLCSIAYPAISCGAHHFPPQEAARVSIESIREFSYNVKDVRFVLFDTATYEIFLKEWTDYAQKVNREANSIDQTPVVVNESSKTLSSTSISSTNYCILCQDKKLSVDEQLLCNDCLKMARAEMFNAILTRLRLAAEKSYDELKHVCQMLKPILKSYPLVYTPVQIFDQSIHKRDHIAETYLQTYCTKEFRNFMPMAIIGDGNCFYNAFVKLGGGGAGTTTDTMTLTSVELRARNIIELVLNIDDYIAQYGHLSCFLENFEDYVRKEMMHDTNLVAIWDLLSIPTVLNITLISVYPKVNDDDDLHHQYINNMLFIPLIHEDENQEQNNGPIIINKEVRLLFSNGNRVMMDPSQKKDNWLPNHFVPLLNFK
ncbi:unnamed protein product [Adineta steineri]|uniref:Macro domain-containing protein n=1 Tax=Adineta steineri TaxID=433720 RepID=A0A813TG62_9BILA|nr:unnamed protein product [Adineta steineri]CAF3677852.1 unnamed protein product [Adineta steineri]